MELLPDKPMSPLSPARMTMEGKECTNEILCVTLMLIKLVVILVLACKCIERMEDAMQNLTLHVA